MSVPYKSQPAAVDATKNEYEADRDEREAEQRIADETRPLEADKIEQADALAAREPPKQRQASGVDQCPVHRQPWLSVMPWSRRCSQGEDGCDNGLRSDGTSCARKQHQCRAAPRQHCCLPPPKEGLVGIRVHDRNLSFLGEDRPGGSSRISLQRALQRYAVYRNRRPVLPLTYEADRTTLASRTRTHPVRGKGRSPPVLSHVSRTFFQPDVRTTGGSMKGGRHVD